MVNTKKIYTVYCSYPYTKDPKGTTAEINKKCKEIYEATIPNGNDLILLIPHNVFDHVYDFPVGDSNSWMSILELGLIERCDIFAFDPANVSTGCHWEKTFAELIGKPITTYAELKEGYRP